MKLNRVTYDGEKSDIATLLVLGGFGTYVFTLGSAAISMFIGIGLPDKTVPGIVVIVGFASSLVYDSFGKISFDLKRYMISAANLFALGALSLILKFIIQNIT